MADHRCPACGAGVPRVAGFCPACGTAVNAPALPFEAMSAGSAVTEHEVALGAGRPNPKRGALVVSAVAVLVIGGGLIVGAGSGDDGEQGSSSTPSTTLARPTTTDPPTRTSVRRTTTTSTVPTYTAAPIPELAGAPLYAIVEDRVIRIDTATGQSVVLGDGTRQLRESPNLMPRQGGVVVWGSFARFFPDDGSEPVFLLGSGELWPAADPALVWLRDFATSNGDGEVIRLVRVDSGEDVALVPVPAFSRPVGDDGTGRLMVTAEAGGVFTIDASTGAAVRTSDTKVVAATPSHLLLLRCDDALVCGHELVDRATGDVGAVAIEGASSYAAYSLDPTGTRVVLLEYDAEGPVFRIIEFSSGAEVGLDAEETFFYGVGAVTASWTPDGQHLVMASNSSIAMWTPGSDEPAEYQVTDSDGNEAIVVAVALGR